MPRVEKSKSLLDDESVIIHESALLIRETTNRGVLLLRHCNTQKTRSLPHFDFLLPPLFL